MPTGDVTIHDVLADEVARYVHDDGVISGGLDRALDLGLWLSAESGALVVDRLPGWAAYPRQSGPARLFTRPGAIRRAVLPLTNGLVSPLVNGRKVGVPLWRPPGDRH